MKLYEITEQFKMLARMDDLDEVTAADTLEAITGDFKSKAVDVGSALATITHEAELDVNKIDSEIARLTAIKKRLTNREKWLKEYLLTNMVACGISEIKCDSPFVKISTHAGRDVVVIDSLDDVPTEFLKIVTTLTPIKASIYKEWKEGRPVKGTHIETNPPTLRVK